MKSNSSDIYIMTITAIIVLVILLCFIISFLFIYKGRQARHQSEMKKAKERYEEEILRTQLEIKEQTLKNISEEIHDNVGQILSLAILNLSAIELNNNERAAAKIEHITNLVEKAVRDLRGLSKTLDADNIANVGLASIIRFELELLQNTGLYETSFNVSGIEKKLLPSREIVIYRIVQESINNLIKHARATTVEINMAFSDEQLLIEIADNGKGFDTSKMLQDDIHKNGAGIKNMTNRAKLIDALLSIKSVISVGTKVTMTIPFIEERKQQ